MRRPPKRLYPDYYQFIQRPIALDDIKKGLDTGTYLSLEHVKQDFELCFSNAKRYNVKESEIWKDAKFLNVCSHLPCFLFFLLLRLSTISVLYRPFRYTTFKYLINTDDAATRNW
jgi:hypothetical protein